MHSATRLRGPRTTFYQLPNQRVRIYLTVSLTHLLAFSARSLEIRFIDSMETVYSPIFFRRFIRIEPFNTGQATFGFICPVGAGFGVCSGRRGRREKTVLTLQLLTIKEGVVQATQAAD